MAKGTKNPDTKNIADTAYGQIFFENTPFFMKIEIYYEAIWILLN